MAEQYSNDATSTLDGAILAADLSLVLVDASAFPATGDFRLKIGSEILICTARTGNTLTVTRAEEGTTAASYSSGTRVAHVLTAESLTALITESSGDVSGPGSSTDNEIPRFSGTGGGLLQGSGITIADGASGTLAGTNSGDVTLGGTPTYITIAGQVITRNAVSLSADVSGDLPLANLAQSSAASRLLGRGSASGAGDFQEITLGAGLSMSGTALSASSAVATRTVGITIDGGGSAISTGVKGYIVCPFAGTITKATLLADQSGSIVIDVWKDTYANFPPTVADTITASAKPTLSSAQKAQDATLTGWATSITAGDVFGFNVDSATTVTRATLTLEVTV